MFIHIVLLFFFLHYTLQTFKSNLKCSILKYTCTMQGGPVQRRVISCSDSLKSSVLITSAWLDPVSSVSWVGPIWAEPSRSELSVQDGGGGAAQGHMGVILSCRLADSVWMSVSELESPRPETKAAVCLHSIVTTNFYITSDFTF